MVSSSNEGFIKPDILLMWAYAAHTRAFVQKLSATKRGSVTACRLPRGHRPQGISKGKPLRHAFRIFPRERKDTAVWSAQLHEGRFAETLVRSKVSNFSFLPRNKVTSNFRFCGLVPPTLALTFLLREKSAKAYPRGGVLLDISSFVTKL